MAGLSNHSLSVEGLGVLRGERLVFRDLSFGLEPGGAVLLTGPNGAGKTTLLMVLAGLLPHQAGTIRFGGGALPEHVALSTHLDAVKPVMTVAENLAFWAAYAGTPAAVAPALETLNLTALADLPAGLLSQGQKRRAALARLLVCPRPVWLLDEPSVSLDAASVGILTGLIADHRAAGGSVLVSSHIPLGLGDAAPLDLGARA